MTSVSSSWKVTVKRLALVASSAFTLAGCTTTPPQNTENLCAIFEEYPQWYEYAKNSEKKWKTPITVQMAIVHQESRFVADAQPPMEWALGIIPLGRASDAYGYPQAKDLAWEEYMDKTQSWGADRDDMEDALDFIGWYNSESHKLLKISYWNAKDMYLAYHEGRGGYQKKTYNQKPWLIDVSKKVAYRSRLYSRQLDQCKAKLEEDLNSGWF